MMSERQIRGIIAVSIFLAIIPLISFLSPFLINSKVPILSTSGSGALIVEVVTGNGETGVYFVEPGTSVRKLFSILDSRIIIKEDFLINNGMKIRFFEKDNHHVYVIEKMEAAKRLALGLRLDINLASQDELILIPGVGDALATSIVDKRAQVGRFEKLSQIMEIKGIKEKKLSELSKYLYIDELAE